MNRSGHSYGQCGGFIRRVAFLAERREVDLERWRVRRTREAAGAAEIHIYGPESVQGTILSVASRLAMNRARARVS